MSSASSEVHLYRGGLHRDGRHARRLALAIGFYFACTGGRQRSQREYLLAEGKMNFLPVCLSLFATFQSAIGLLGVPADVYEYGTMVVYNGLGVVIANLITAFTIAPLFHPLQLVSVYQYLEMRYNSRIVRWIGVCIGMMWTTLYMGMALLSPALAMKGVTEIPIWMSVVVVAAIGTVYTTVGGMKSVLWTDVFQTAIIFAGLIAVIIQGIIEIGGGHELYTISQRGQRLVFDDISPDPRVRHTLWGFLFGYTVYWLSCNLTQSSIQRISSTKSVRHAKLAFLTALPVNICYAVCQVSAGLCMYAFFIYTGCDPLRAGHVTTSNQVIIYYVVKVMGFLPGFSGLYLATILSGSLSTLSSGINSLAANTTEDLLRRPLSKLSPASVTKVTKVIALFFGFVVTGVAYTFRGLEGPVSQLTTTILGASSGPVTGLFIMGFVFPGANKFGAITGSVGGPCRQHVDECRRLCVRSLQTQEACGPRVRVS
ncbi:sodium-dependent multivitamin transporter-like [Pomacea canaliculata]|uniref:sodium-dependent multivitamin transporter-like n=1 Tax=Pomacea canaliculata TaxID=400727 RepID=UPI000D7288A3|nr:sodium-dependent multivitamin transporter-like [Pomacea canaliculata]XP_025107086.1 sodium-dependent multivitamin transporter-like [Pomacea canaliculata]